MGDPNNRVSFLYRHISHVEDLEPGQTEDDFKAEIIAKYAALDAKRDGKTPPKNPAPDPDPAPAPTAPGDDGTDLPTPDYTVIESKGKGWFNVVDGAGTPANEKALRFDAAEELAAAMNSGDNPGQGSHPDGF